MIGESKAQSRNHGHEMQLKYTVGSAEIVRRHDDDETELLGVHLFQALHDGHMLGQRLLQIVRTLVADLHEQGGGLPIDEGKDTVIHVVVAGNGPMESLSKGIERPESGIVALGGDDLAGANQRSHLTSQVVGTSDVSGEHRDGVQPQTINTHHSGVFVFVLDVWCNGANADAHGSNEHEAIELVPLLTNVIANNNFGAKFALKDLRNILASFTDLNNCNLHIILHSSFFTLHFPCGLMIR